VASKINILVVDDEAALRRLLHIFLERNGYAVESCGTATEGLELFGKEPERFAVVVADLSLPDMQGNDMALRMKEQSPKLKVLLCSGYPFELATLPPSVQESFSVLQKPFLPNMLTAAVDQLLKR
jgi:DNA-binding NtrC family response regulator